VLQRSIGQITAKDRQPLSQAIYPRNPAADAISISTKSHSTVEEGLI
jgi:hypothetical protein